MSAKSKNKSTKESPVLTPEEKLEVWDLVLRTEPWTPGLARAFCSEEGGMYGLTEKQIATHPLVLKFLHQIRKSTKSWLEEQKATFDNGEGQMRSRRAAREIN